MQLIYPAVFCNYEDEKCYVVRVPDLPGCTSWGETLAEAMMMGIDAASGWVLDELEDGKPAPKASHISDIHPDPDEEGGFVSMLILDMDAYAAKYGKKDLNPVQRDITIPAWLNSFAEEKRIDYSEVLQGALTELYVHENTAVYRSDKKLY